MSQFIAKGYDASPMTGGAIKQAYENQPNTNPFDDESKDRLSKSQLSFDVRNQENARKIADLGHGGIGAMAGHFYLVDTSVAQGCCYDDLGVSNLIPTGSVTPFHWGAVEEPEGTFGGTDQSDRLQRFFDYINDNTLFDVNWTGAFSISKPLTLGASAAVKTMYCRGRLFIRAMTDMDVSVVRVDRLANNSIWGDLFVQCYGGADFNLRKTPVGIEVGQISRANIGAWLGQNAKFWGVWFTTEPGVKSSNLFKAQKLGGLASGSGYSGSGSSHMGTMFGIIHYGTAGSTSQATRISPQSIDSMPPVELENYGIFSTETPFEADFQKNDGNPIFIEVQGRLHQVVHIERDQVAFWVYPQLDHSIPNGSPTPFRWIYGGGVALFGSDSNVAEIGIIEASNCGIAASFGMFYGPKVGMMLADAVGIAVHIGGNVGNSCFGTNISSLYVEGADRHIVTTSLGADFEIGTTIALDLGRIETTTSPSDDQGRDTRLHLPLQKGRVAVPGRKIEGQKLPGNKVGSAVEFILDRAGRQDVYKTNNVQVNLSIPENMNDLTGVDSGQLDVIGTGADTAPTEVKFKPPQGHKINGGATDAEAVFDGFSKFASFLIFHDIANADWQVLQR